MHSIRRWTGLPQSPIAKACLQGKQRPACFNGKPVSRWVLSRNIPGEHRSQIGRQPPALPTDRVSVLPEIGSATIEAVHATVGLIAVSASCHSATVRVGYKHDALIASRDTSAGRGCFVAHADQLLSHQIEQLSFQLQRVGDLSVSEPCHVACRLHVCTELNNIHQHLHVPHTLLITSMLASRQQGFAILRNENRRPCLRDG
jgi:hypothetical protein